MNFSELNILLIQARTSPAILQQEQECFIERCRIAPEQLHSINLPERVPTPDILYDVDALMIGGAGEFSATQTYSWMPPLLDLVRVATENSLPTFGSCWGHQIIARALGGTVIHDPEHAEMGCHWVELTEAGRRDELFGQFPQRFRTNMGHHDRVTHLPDSAIELARSDSQPNQAFRIAGKPVYGTQFHSELDARRERERLYEYRKHYPETGDDEAFKKIIDGLAETTEVDNLLHLFLLTFVCKVAHPSRR